MQINVYALYYLTGLIATSIAIIAAGWSALPDLLVNGSTQAIEGTVGVMKWMAASILVATVVAIAFQVRREKGWNGVPSAVLLMALPVIPGTIATCCMFTLA